MMKTLKSKLSTLLILICMPMAWAYAAAPTDLMLVFDNSGSMRKNDPHFVARKVLDEFISKLDPGTRAGLIIFDQTVKEALPLTAMDEAAKRKFAASFSGIDYKGKFTDSPSAFERAVYELKTNARPDAAKVIVFMTDGIVDTGNRTEDADRTKWLREELAADAANSGIKIVAIAFTAEADLFLIQSLAKNTNGEYYRAPAAADLPGVFAKISDQLAAPAVVAVPPPLSPAPAAPAAAPETLAGEAAQPEATPSAPEAALSSVPAAPAAQESAPEAAPAAPSTGTGELSADERAALESLAKETGVPVEQLMSELKDTPPGQAVVVGPPPAPAAKSGMMAIVLAGIAVVLLAGGAFWFFKRKGTPPEAAAAAPVVATRPTPRKIPEAYLNDSHYLTHEPPRRLGEKPLMIGRIAGNDTEHLDFYVVNQQTVGRRHAVIKYKDHSFWIVDQGSVNGTFVNGERVAGERQLKHGDRIKFHKHEFEFTQPDMEDAARAVFGETIAGDATVIGDFAATMAAPATSIRPAVAPVAPPPPASTVARAMGASGAAVAADEMFDFDDRESTVETPEPLASLDVLDITGESVVDAIARDRDEFFSSSGAPAQPKTGIGAITLDDGGKHPADMPAIQRPAANFEMPSDEEHDDDGDLGVEVNVDAVNEKAKAQQLHEHAQFEAEASAFFDDGTVGPIPDMDSGSPRPDDDDMFDLEAPPATSAAQSTDDAALAQATVVLKSAAPAAPGRFNETVTRLREDLQELPPTGEGDVTLEDFIATTSFDAPKTVLPNAPTSAPAGESAADEFMRTEMLRGGRPAPTNEDATLLPDAVPSATQDEDIFDVTGMHQVPPPGFNDTVVLPGTLEAREDRASMPSEVPPPPRPTPVAPPPPDDDDGNEPTIIRPPRKR